MATVSKYRITARELIQTIDNWEHLINFRVNLVGCGGTALTLLEIKDSTKDIDFIIPVVKEYERLMKFLRSLGYEEKGSGLAHPDDPYFLYQFWVGNRVFTTDLLDSPLDPGKNILIKKWRHIYLGALNLQDLIITKMFRGMQVDVDDCVAAFAKFEIDPEELLKRYAEAAKYDLNPERMIQNFIVFSEALFEKGFVTHGFLEKVAAYK
ncbi:MAG TPA: hypothetical protein VMW42_06105 [Desulfatiglandales bacterium]|nr:hypothetical protein [Desulfatiglandales bacterium]